MIAKAVDGTGNTRFGIDQGWLWLAKLVNLRPHPATTATVLGGFLAVCGKKFTEIYGRQAYKLLRFLKIQYIPLICDLGSEGDGGATERLKLSLDSLISH